MIRVAFPRPAAADDEEADPLPSAAEVSEFISLTSSRSDIGTCHVALALDDTGIANEPGDSLGFLPTNDPALVEDVLRIAGLASDTTLHAALSRQSDITLLTSGQVSAYAALTGDSKLTALSSDEAELTRFLADRQFVDLPRAAPHALTADQRTGLLRSLPPRLYSVASSRKHDFLYQVDWQDWRKAGLLDRIDLAFSRDQRDKVYVQHRMWQSRRDLYAWVQEDAVIYVCGDAKAMAKDVHAVLLSIIIDQSGAGTESAAAPCAVCSVTAATSGTCIEMTELSRNEYIKDGSKFLRGPINEELLDQITGGLTAPEWLAMDDLAQEHANGTIRLTTRQTIQFHGIIKTNLRPAIQGSHAALLDTVAACGDVDRNVIASTVPHLPDVHAAVLALANGISDRLRPQARAPERDHRAPRPPRLPRRTPQTACLEPGTRTPGAVHPHRRPDRLARGSGWLRASVPVRAERPHGRQPAAWRADDRRTA